MTYQNNEEEIEATSGHFLDFLRRRNCVKFGVWQCSEFCREHGPIFILLFINVFGTQLSITIEQQKRNRYAQNSKERKG